MRHWQTGEVLLTRPLGDVGVGNTNFPTTTCTARISMPCWRIHWSMLPGAVRLGVRVNGFESAGNGVKVHLEDDSDMYADLVGADGIHLSAAGCLALTRLHLLAASWRATLPASAPANHVRPVASDWLGPVAWHYYLRRGELVNCVGVQEAMSGWPSPGQRG